MSYVLLGDCFDEARNLPRRTANLVPRMAQARNGRFVHQTTISGPNSRAGHGQVGRIAPPPRGKSLHPAGAIRTTRLPHKCHSCQPPKLGNLESSPDSVAGTNGTGGFMGRMSDPGGSWFAGEVFRAAQGRGLGRIAPPDWPNVERFAQPSVIRSAGFMEGLKARPGFSPGLNPAILHTSEKIQLPPGGITSGSARDFGL